MKWPIIGLIGLGLAAALCIMILANVLLKRESNAETEKEVTVWVAAEDLPPMTLLRLDMVREKKILASEAERDAAKDSSRFAGRVLVRALQTGQQICLSDLAPKGTGPDLAGLLGEGKRAMTVALSDWEGMEGLLYPGSVVDVIVSFPVRGSEESAVSTVHVQRVQVLSVDTEVVGEEVKEQPSTDEKRPPARASTSRRRKLVTLMVDPEQAQALQLALQHGTITLTLRNPNDRMLVEAEPTVLDAGRLAKAGKAMTPSSDQSSTAPPLPSAPNPVVPTATRSVERRTWEVLILRGSQSEVQQLPWPGRMAPQPSPPQ